MTCWRALAVSLAAAILLVSCAARTPSKQRDASRVVLGHAAASTSAPVTSGSTTPNHPLDVQIELDRTTVRAGESISGEVIVTNATAHALEIADCNGGWIQVGLTNATVSYDPAWESCLSFPGTTLPVGTTRIPIKLSTTYNACTQDAGSATADLPACLPSRGDSIMPPLPPGSYTTMTAMLDPKGVHLPSPEPIKVTVTS